MLNVHAAGGRRMMEAASAALADLPHPPLLIAVTVLTSMAKEDLEETGVPALPADQVLRLARLAQACQLDGVVCSAHEATALRASLGSDFRLVTPGIRPPGAEAADQRRVMTPVQALHAGATDLVIGRPITAADDPLIALQQIHFDIQNAQE
jgi:orotidine-5'-phosphate decarboxylase